MTGRGLFVVAGVLGVRLFAEAPVWAQAKAGDQVRPQVNVRTHSSVTVLADPQKAPPLPRSRPQGIRNDTQPQKADEKSKVPGGLGAENELLRPGETPEPRATTVKDKNSEDRRLREHGPDQGRDQVKDRVDPGERSRPSEKEEDRSGKGALREALQDARKERRLDLLRERKERKEQEMARDRERSQERPQRVQPR